MFAGPALSDESATPSNSLSPLTIVNSNSGKLHFSKAEQDWLSQNHVVHVRVGDYAPIQLFNKKPSGIAVDYLNAIAEKIGIQIEYRKEIHWADTLNKIRDHKGVDLLLGAMSTEERRKYLAFTDVYLSFPSVIFTRKDSDFINSLQDLSGKIVAVQNKVVVHNLLVEKYPDLNLLLKDTEEDALHSLVTGESDAYVGNLTVGSFYIQSNSWNNTKVAAPTGFDPQNLSMAVRSDWPELAQIINKTLTTFTTVDHATMRSQWSAPIRYEYGISKTDVIKWVLGIAAIASLLIGTVLFWNKRLQVEINSRTKVEKTLKQLLETFELAQKMAKVGHWSYNIETQQPIWSEEMFKVFGCDPDKGVPNYEGHKELFHPDDWKMFDKSVQGAIKENPYNIEARIIFPDGSIHWCNTQGFPHYDQDGNVVELFGTTQDITERKQAESDLQKSEEKYRSLAEECPISIMTFNHKGVVTFVNKWHLKTFARLKHGPEFFIGKKITELPGLVSAKVIPDLEKVLQGKSVALEDVHFPEFTGGHSGYQSIKAVPIYKKGAVVGGILIREDVSKRKHAEDALRESEEKYKHLFNNAPAGIYEIDFKKIKFINVNEVMCKYSGYSEKEFLALNPLDLLTENSKNLFIGRLEKLSTKANQVGSIEYNVIRKDGQELCVILSNDYIYKNGKLTGSRVVVHDITELKKAQEEKIEAQKIAGEQKKLALVGQVAGKMAHDFNNILGIIMGNTELSLLDCKEEATTHTLELIFEQTIRGKNLTKNLVAFAKDQEPKQEFFRISEKIDLVLSLLKKDLQGIELIKEDKAGVPDLLADPGMIEHAFVNLIQNSIHAVSLVEHPRIINRIYSLDDDICIEIEDNGCGIPKEHLENIFEPSFTLKGSKDTTGSYGREIKGTGYGMANVKKHIEQHKGNISVESEIGSGTKITISLPIIKKELTNQEKAEIQKENIYFDKYILLVEDESAISGVQYKILSQEPCNHKVDIAHDGQVAIDLFKRNEYDLISLDYVLPGGINGMDVYDHVRKINKAIPILFISGNIEFLESIKELKQKDANIDHLSKPCQNKDYVKSINELFERSLASQE